MASSDDAPEDVFQPTGWLRLELLTDNAAHTLRESLRLARETRWDSVRSPHVFMGLLAVPDAGVRNWGERLAADLATLLGQFQELFHQEDGEVGALLLLHREFLSDNAIRLIREARNRAAEYKRIRITPMDLLISLLSAPNSIVAECFERIGVSTLELTQMAVMAEEQTRRG
jgi:ATP-dependent Clp protease ATP-binding subunit ClpA